MRYAAVSVLLVGIAAIVAAGCTSPGQSEGPSNIFGPPIPADAEFTEVADLVKNAKKYAEKDIFLQGEVTNQCPTSGCWIDVVGLQDESGVTVTVHMRGPAFDDRIGEIRGKLKGKKVKVKGYVSVRGEKPEVHASSLEIAD